MRHADYSWQVRMYLHPVVIYLDHACGYSCSTHRKRVWPAGNSTVRVAPHATRVTGCVHASACNRRVTMTQKLLLSKCHHEPHTRAALSIPRK